MPDNIIESNFYTMRDDHAETTFRYPVEIIKNPKGAKGDKGSSAKVVKTTATGLAEDAQPTATHETVYNAETDTNETSITFGIPQGKTGYTPQVESIETRTLAAGEDASVLIEAGEENPKDVKITVSIPEGEKGDTGEDGEQGLPALFATDIHVETLTPDQSASAKIELADPETNTWRLSLDIPQGVKGDTPPTPDLIFHSITFTDDEGGAKAVTTLNKDKNAYEVNLTLPKFKGDKGDDGVSPRFIGSYDSLADISATPEYGNLATVTTDGIDELFFYDGAQWQNMATLTGAKGDKGDKGDTGEAGKDGASVKFVGFFDGVADIVTKVTEPEENNMAVVTKDGAQYLAFYTGNDWIDLAKISGDKGEQGERGEQGEQGLPAVLHEVTAIAGDEAGAQLTRVSEEDNTYNLLLTIPRGADGKDGKDGESFTFADLTDEQKAELKGDKGEQGPAGPQGEQGPAGPAGPQGEKGEKGDQGPAGPQGEQGPAGPAGPQGEKGEKGDQGPAGPAGPQGEKGEKGDQGPAGPQGEQGASGVDGAPAIISSIDVHMGEVSSADVQKTEDDENSYVIDLTIPWFVRDLYTLYKVHVPVVKDDWYDGAKVSAMLGDQEVERYQNMLHWTYRGGAVYIPMIGEELYTVGAFLLSGTVEAEDEKTISLPSGANSIKIGLAKGGEFGGAIESQYYLVVSFNPTDIKTELLTWGELKNLELTIMAFKDVLGDYKEVDYQYENFELEE